MCHASAGFFRWLVQTVLDASTSVDLPGTRRLHYSTGRLNGLSGSSADQLQCLDSG